MKIFKVLDVKTPARGTSKSAGIDFFVPENTDEFRKEFIEKNPSLFLTDDGFSIPPQCRVNIPSGIKASVPMGHALIAFNKSGVSLKYGLDVGASVVDEDYQGEIHLSLVNTSREPVFVSYGQKIVQFILIPILYSDIEEVSKLEYCFPNETERGSGAFGSTGER